MKTPDPSLISQADIDAELRHGTGTEGGKLRVFAFYQQEHSVKEAVAFLKHEYGTMGHSHTLLDGSRGFVDYSPIKGMVLRRYEPELESKLTWNAVDKRLRALVEARQYLTTEELASLITQADIDALLVRDWNVPGRKERIYELIRSGLSDEQMVSHLTEEYTRTDPYAQPSTGGNCTLADGSKGFAYYVSNAVRIENRDNGGWREVEFDELAAHIRALIDAGQYLTPEERAALEEPPAPEAPTVQQTAAPPDPQTAIDDALREWNGDPASVRRVAAHMEVHARDKDTAAFLRAEYGDELPAFPITGAGVAMDMPWPKVQRRIAQLIRDGRFLPNSADLTQEESAPVSPNPIEPAAHDDADAYRLLSRLRADCDYFLGAGQREEKHLWAGSVKAQIAKMRELYDSASEKPEWLTVQDIERYERQMTGLEPETVKEAVPSPNVLAVEPTPYDPAQPPYHVGQTVYLDDTAFQITGLRGTEVELLDPSMLYPIFRAESRESFERLLRRDPRNGPITEFLAAELHTLDDDLTDALTNCLLKHNDKAYIAGWFRAGESNTRVAQRLSDTYAQRAETLTLETGDAADLFTSTVSVELDIHDKFNTKRAAAWDDVACMLRALYQWELDGFEQPMVRYTVRETSDAFEEPFIIWDRQVDGYYLVDDVCQTFTDEKEAKAYADQLNSGENTLEGVPAYQVGDHVTLPTHDREISGTVGYVGDKEVRIDTGPYAWSNQVVDRESFEEGLRHDERNADLFTPEDKLPADANFHITDDDLGVGGPKVKYAANVAAIRTLKQIEAEGRNATAAEQETLSRYVGWGGIPDAFDPGKESWAKEYTELKGLLTEAEYEFARASTLNAHYTSPTVIKAIYEAVGNLGYSTGNILEPSCGVGNFFGLLPESMAASKLYGVELDSISGRIAQQLYPKANVAVRGFEKTSFPNDFFDLAIGNVPFGQYQVSDPDYNKLGFNIHNYFLAKTLDKLRPGGVAAMLTTRYTLDAKDSAVRQYLAQRADLLGAVRLPNNAFKANAGTKVVTDILFFQKRDSPPVQDPAWVQAVQTPEGFSVNHYFQEHPEMVLGTPDSESTQYGHQDYTVAPTPGAVLADQLHEAVSRIHGQITVPELPDLGDDEPIDAAIPADPDVPNFSYTVKDGVVYYRENSVMLKPELTATAAARVKGMVELRDCTRALISDQMENRDDTTIAHQQERLNQLYDTFTAKFGLINSKGNALAFADDSAYYLLCSLEVLDDDGNLERKADMFTKRTIQPHRAVTHVDTAAEALAVSIAERAKVDIAYMENLSGKTEDELAGELKGVIFRLPEPVGEDGRPRYAAADDYLSGNIRQKLARARQAAEQVPALFRANVEALEQAMPKDLDATEIDVRLGATWVDKQYIQQFMYETFQTPNYLKDTIGVNFSTFTAEWNIAGKTKIPWNNVAAFTTYGTERASAYRILEDSLNLRDVRIYDTVRDPGGSERRVFNAKETTLAQQKQQAVKDAFRDWIWKDPERRRALTRKYNDLYNSIRPREYDGRHITFGGINPEITLREHQLNAIAHVLYGNNVLLAHEVGAGKTFEMAAAAMESKRLGLCQKSLFAVPNHLIEQWASEFLRLYPSANILVARKKDFERANRKKFCAKIATGDYDAIIMGHSQFERLPVSMERRERLLKDQILEITQGIEEMTANGAEKFSIKQLERTKRSLEARLEKLQDGTRKDDVVTFEQLGVDRLFVDEAHSYKNCAKRCA